MTDIAVSRDWQADVTLQLDRDVRPLRRGTVAVIRQASLTGVANRYVDLQMPDGRAQTPIPDGGEIGTDRTRSAVDLDQLFAALGPRQRRGLQDVIQGSAASFAGRSGDLERGLR